ncbi:Cof-type HAD-IIB family hydrolase [Streptococcus sciuri]|uniref:Cof-type HAD-IIB family hydrolase n=1 Tax=Streptococcus sciuri TaxID=2973939 RepID=A0ABT2F7G9_9STRE|nr:Cof-type HAD-IIB family hydrolase [Streptococcus sciuri]MCS4488330.1 Cof-type HAD-IIB family hydrolase [Streptococcus sciuri]
MIRKDIKMIAIDLDGTLFNAQKEISKENRRALERVRKQGVKVVITTGRPLKAIGTLLSDLHLLSDDDYCITFNGGLVQRTTGEILDKSVLTYEDLKTIHTYLEPLGLPFDVLSDGIVYSLPSRGNKSLYHTANPLLTFVEVEHFEDIPLNIPYNKVVTVTDEKFLDEQLPKLPDVINEKYEAFKSREIIFEIMPKGVHKASGLAHLCQHLGLTNVNVMAIGDEANDISMIRWAGLGVAMANATDQVKRVANSVTKRNNEASGVAEAIERYVLGEAN